MQLRRWIVVPGLAVAVTASVAVGCARRRVEVRSGDTGAVGAVGAMTITARLAPMSGSSITGTATAAHGDEQSFRSSVSISGATPNATHPWHVHSGHCGENGPIVGPPSSYPVLQADANGAASASATIPVPMPSGPLYVNVHQSPTQLGTSVSCGNLEMGQ